MVIISTHDLSCIVEAQCIVGNSEFLGFPEKLRSLFQLSVKHFKITLAELTPEHAALLNSHFTSLPRRRAQAGASAPSNGTAEQDAGYQ